MKRYLTTSALALVTVVAASQSARADCDVMMRDYDAQLAERPEYRAALVGGLQRDVRELRNAAYILQNHGKDGACEEVVAAAQELVENPEEAAEASMSYDEWNAREMERIKNAQPVTEMVGQLRAEEMIGADVRNLENENLGEVSDVILAKEGGASHIVLSHGGFFGLGETEVAVPFDKLKVAGERDVFYLDMTEEQLENAPSFERGTREWVEDDEWRQDNQQYYDES
jgi:sporulation protein YlmC with PRC-barrel domain